MRKDFANLKKSYSLRYVQFFENENFAARATSTLAAKFSDFFGIDLLKIYLISRNV